MIDRSWTIAWIDKQPHYATSAGTRWHVVNLSTSEVVTVPGRLLGAVNDHLVVAYDKRIAIMTYPCLYLLENVSFEHTISSSAGDGRRLWLTAGGEHWKVDLNPLRLSRKNRPGEQAAKVWYNPESASFFFASFIREGVLIQESGRHARELLLETTSAPVLAGWSETALVLRVPQRLVTWDFASGSVNCAEDCGSLAIRSTRESISLTYQIDHTTLTTSRNPQATVQLPFTVEKVLSLDRLLLVIGHSANNPSLLSLVDPSTGVVRSVGAPLHSLITELHPGTPPILMVRNREHIGDKGLFFLPGGPHQPAGNVWDPLVYTFATHGYTVAIPQYYGVIGTVDRTEGMSHYGIRDVIEARNAYAILQQTHGKLPIVGHSYGCYLGAQVTAGTNPALFVGLNGVYDLETAAELCPNIFSQLSPVDRRTRSNLPDLRPNEKWCHLSSKTDPVIGDALKRSLERISPASPAHRKTIGFDGHAVNSLNSADVILRSFHNFAKSLGVT